jgi:arylsulfatase A-like enzyme
MVASAAERRFRTSALSILSAAAIVAFGAGCAGVASAEHVPTPVAVAESAGHATRAAGAPTEHVVIVSVDGLRPDAIGRFGARNIERMMREGSHTLAATTISPSKTLPSHTSMLTGEGPEKHGITWNSNETDTHATVAIPTVFGVARAKGLRTAAFFSKGKFNHLEVPGSLDYTQAPNGNGKWSAKRTVGDVERYLAKKRPNLLFVHLGEPDYAGHVFGWMSWFYGRAVRKADDAVGRLLAAADRAYGKGGYTVLLTADHGGHGRSHGSAMHEDVTIPWIAYGQGVRAGSKVGGAVRTMDTAGTALWLLGVDAPAGWAGTAVTEAFVGDASLAVGE